MIGGDFMKGYIIVGGERIDVDDIVVEDDFYVREMNKIPRFKPSWVPIGEYFVVGDFRGTPKKIEKNRKIRFGYDDRAKVDLNLCRDICEMMNELDKSYQNTIKHLVRRLEFWKKCYLKVDKRNKKLEKVIVEKEIGDD